MRRKISAAILAVLLLLPLRAEEDAGEATEPGKRPAYTETNARRAEIIFLLAAPFVILGQMLAVGTIYLAANKKTDFDFPPEAVAFAGLSSVLITTYITWDDYSRNRPQRDEKKDLTLYFGFTGRF